MDAERAEALVRHRTSLGAPPLVPQVRLHLGTGVLDLWEGLEEQTGRTGSEPPFWAFAWPGGQALARCLLDGGDLVRGRRVLDVASGSGLVAIAAALAGAAAVVANDVDPLAVAAIHLNAASSGVEVATTTDDLLDGDGGEAEVVLVGDAVYQRDLAERVTGLLRRAAGRGATALLGDPGRAYLPREGLEEVASYDVPVLEELEGTAVRRATVWRVLPR